MHIIGMLSEPTCFNFHVVYSCGIYCNDATTIGVTTGVGAAVGAAAAGGAGAAIGAGAGAVV